jgi:hypothetical protein
MAKLIHADRFQKSSTMVWRAFTCLLLELLLGLLSFKAQAADMSEVERQVKAAYLYKLAGYVEWPEKSFAGAASPLVIGVVDANTMADELSQVAAGRTVNGRP